MIAKRESFEERRVLTNQADVQMVWFHNYLAFGQPRSWHATPFIIMATH